MVNDSCSKSNVLEIFFLFIILAKRSQLLPSYLLSMAGSLANCWQTIAVRLRNSSSRHFHCRECLQLIWPSWVEQKWIVVIFLFVSWWIWVDILIWCHQEHGNYSLLVLHWPLIHWKIIAGPLDSAPANPFGFWVFIWSQFFFLNGWVLILIMFRNPFFLG